MNNNIKTFIKMTIQEIDTKKTTLLIKVKSLQNLKNSNYGAIDISMPMSEEEKQLTKEIANIWSEINQLVILKNKLKKNLVL